MIVRPDHLSRRQALALVGKGAASAALLSALRPLPLFANPAAFSPGPFPTFGHPQNFVYQNPSQWLKLELQSHWSGFGDSQDPTMAPHFHVHIIAPHLCVLPGAEVVFGFELVAFHTAGRIRPFYAGAASEITYDQTGTSTPPEMVGDPQGVRVWTGHFTLDPRTVRWQNPHGWCAQDIQGVIDFPNGNGLWLRTRPEFFSTVDTSVPFPRPGVGGYGHVNAIVNPLGSEGVGGWGDNFVKTFEEVPQAMIPLGPIYAPWGIYVKTAGYGGQGLPAVFQYRADVDFHGGNPGRILKEVVQDGDIDGEVIFDPAQLGSGTHKIALMRSSRSLLGDQQLVTVVAFPVHVGEGVPPPPPLEEKCGDGIDNDNDGLIDEGCAPPPPPPPPPVNCSATLHPNGLVSLNPPGVPCQVNGVTVVP